MQHTSSVQGLQCDLSPSRFVDHAHHCDSQEPSPAAACLVGLSTEAINRGNDKNKSQFVVVTHQQKNSGSGHLTKQLAMATTATTLTYLVRVGEWDFAAKGPDPSLA